MQILFTGDVMLGRLVNDVLKKNDFRYVWGNTLNIFKKAGFSLINLECAISERGKEWDRTFKVFHFRANPDAIKVLNSASIDYVSLANNHVLDYDVDALFDTINLLDKNNIYHSGAGRNLKEAVSPVFMEKKLESNSDNIIFFSENNDKNLNKDNMKKTIKIGLISLTDNEPGWEATDTSVGINHIPITLDTDKYYYRLKSCIEKTRGQSDLVIVSSHVGPHFRERPSAKYVNFAHQIMEFGADIYWGHGNHMPQGIEIYKPNNKNANKIIIYDCGDFIDDYAVNPNFRNDLSFIFLLRFNFDNSNKFSTDNNEGHNFLQNAVIELVPTKISNFMVNTISPDDFDFDFVVDRMIQKCSELGTKCFVDDKEKRIKIPL